MINFGPSGLTIDTFDVILADVQADFRLAFGSNIATDVNSSAGQAQRLLANREAQVHEQFAALYQSMDPRLAEGVPLVQRNSLLGIEPEAADQAEVLGTATGTAATVIPNGTRLSVGGVEFETIEGPYVIGGGGTVADVRVRAIDDGPVLVSTLGAWTILDTVLGFTSYDDVEQPNPGRLVETNTEYRARAEIERYRRGTGPLAAIEASVSRVSETTYVRAWHNITTDPVDANGIPYLAINVIVDGGEDDDVAAAIWASGPAGHLFYGTDETVLVPDGVGGVVSISFDRVENVRTYVRATLTTSTVGAEEPVAPDDLEGVATAALVAYAAAQWGIGTDVLPHKLVGALASIAGVDGILIETSLDGMAWSSAKRAMTIRERATLAAADVTIVED